MKFKNTDLLRPAAINFINNTFYTAFAKGTIPHREYWDEQDFRCKQGYTAGGIRITGAHYFYLNFTQILSKDETTGRKIKQFPRFLDIDYDFFHIIDKARFEKKGVILVKPRRTGFSYKNAALVTHEFNFMRDSRSLVGSNPSMYGENTMKMVLDNLNFLNKNTEWIKPRSPDTPTLIKARHQVDQDGIKIWKGYQSEVETLSFKDNSSAAIGRSASLMLFEEGGKFNNLIEAFNLSEPCWRDGEDMVGLPVIYGCVCKGTKVWTHNGKEVNIEDLKQEDGIIGYGGVGAIKEPIIWMKPPALKSCLRITTINNNKIECSNDHPLLWSKNNFTQNGRKSVTFKKAEELQVGEQLMFNTQIPIFGTIKIWEPRLVGLLIGDGNYSNNSVPTLAIGDEDIYVWLKFKFENRLSIYKEFRQLNGNLFREVGIKGTQDELRALGIYGQSHKHKNLPINYYDFDLETICEIVGGYFDADGHVSYNIKKNHVRICLTSKYKHLLDQVKELLYKLGIGCNIVKENRNNGFKEGKSEIYRLYISKVNDVEEFQKHITFICKHKQKTLNKILLSKKKKRYSYKDCLFIKSESTDKGSYYLKENNNHLNRLRADTITHIEYIGEQPIYNLNAGITHTYITNGFISGNTGGDMEGGTRDFHEMFFNPDKYNLLSFSNVWDIGKEDTKCGWFIPATRGRLGSIQIGDKDVKIKELLVDNDGNSNESLAEQTIINLRELKNRGKDSKALRDAITQYPFNPQEAFLRSKGSVFPTAELQEHLGNIETNKESLGAGQKGELYFNAEGIMKWRVNGDLQDIKDYPLKKNDSKEGCIVIWQHPKAQTDLNPYGLYIAGCDPYDQDKAESSDSLGSFIIYKTFSLNNESYNQIVAEYTGRPEVVDTYYENCRRLCIYYNAKCLYENMLKGFKNYFLEKHCLHYLYEQPNNMIKDIIKDSKVNRGYGVHMSRGSGGATGIKDQCEQYLKQWLLEERTEINGRKILNLHTILSVPLLKELIAYDRDINTDRVIAFMLCILQSKENHNIYAGETLKPLVDLDPFFKKKHFVKNYRTAWNGNNI